MIGYKIKHYTKLRFLSCGEYPMVYIDDDVMYIYIYIYDFDDSEHIKTLRKYNRHQDSIECEYTNFEEYLNEIDKMIMMRELIS